MKRIWVAVLLLLISLCFSVSEFFAVKYNFEKHVQMLDKAEYYFSQKEFTKSYEQCKKLQSSWAKSEKLLNIFLVHKQVDDIAQDLMTLKKYAEFKDEKSFFLTTGKTKRQLLSMKESELPDYQNIL